MVFSRGGNWSDGVGIGMGYRPQQLDVCYKLLFCYKVIASVINV